MNTTDKPDLSLIIPCYDQAEILEDNFRRIVSYLDRLKLNYELILVEDCSKDDTRLIINRLVREYDSYPVKTIFHEKNHGRGAVVKTGFAQARGKAVGFIDIDLEIAEWYIWPCVSHILQDQFEVVTGYRVFKFGFNLYSLTRHILSYGYRHFVRIILKTSLKDTEAGLKFFHRKKILPVVNMTRNNRWFWDTEIMLLAEHTGLKIKEIPCLCLRNTSKISTVKVFRDCRDYFKEVFRLRSRLKRGITTSN